MRHKKNILRVLSVLFTGFFLTSLFIANINPPKSNAQFSSDNPAEQRYIQWKAYNTVVSCLNTGDIEISGAGTEQDVANRLFNNGSWVTTGIVYAAVVGDGHGARVDCNTTGNNIESINHVLKPLGITSIRQLTDILGAGTKSKDSAVRSLRSYMESNNLAMDINPGVEFWYFDRLFRGGRAGELDFGVPGAAGSENCQGRLSESDGRGGTRAGGGGDPFYYIIRGSDGKWTSQDYTYAYYQLPEGTNFNYLDDKIQPSNPTCIEMARQLTQARRDAYINLLNDYEVATGTQVGSGTNNGDEGGVGEEADSCESKGGVLSWVMCPAVKIIDGTFGWLQTQIEELLYVDKSRYRHSGFRTAWTQMRNLAYIILIPAMLVMVIGTALGFEIFSAYTVKKALPRMVIATIFITLSWEITGFLIEVSNIVGVGVAGIIKAPFGVTNFSSVFNPDASEAAGQWVFLGAGVTAIALSPAVLGIVGSFIGTASLILLTVFLFLVAREIFIVALMLVAPLAILAWIFPGNDKLWKSWWSVFSKLLLIFPIIMAVMAVGLVFASTIGQGAGGDSAAEDLSGVLSPLMKVAAFVIPYAMIPMLFKFAGGFVGNLAGMVNDKEKGMFDRLKNKRSQQYGQLGRDVRGGTFARNNTKGFGGLVSKGLQRGSAPTSVIPGRLGNDARAKLAVATQGNAAVQEAMKDIETNRPMDDGAWNEFIQHGSNKGDLQARIKQLRALGEHGTADSLMGFADKAGDRSYAIAAANMAASAGKLQDASTSALSNYFGTSQADTYAKRQIVGNLAYAQKQKGNFVGAIAGVDDNGVISTYSSMVENGEGAKAQTKMLEKMVEAGPSVFNNMPGYEMEISDGSGGTEKVSAKQLGIQAMMDGQFSTSYNADQSTKDAIKETAASQLVSASTPGAYTDPKTAAYAKKKVESILSDKTQVATIEDTAGGVPVASIGDGTQGQVGRLMDANGRPDNNRVEIIGADGSRRIFARTHQNNWAVEGSSAFGVIKAQQAAARRPRPEELEP